MSRFTDQQSVTRDGQNLTFKTRANSDLPAVAALPGMVGEAKRVLQLAPRYAALDPLPAAGRMLAARYFLTDEQAGPSKKDLARIWTVLRATLVGLSGDLTLKVGAEIEDGDPSTMGYVMRWKGEATKAHHSYVPSLQARKFPWQKPTSYVRGAIHITTDTVIGSLGLVTLIHEATHKYAGTVDYCYFDDDDGMTPTSKFTNKDKALTNADSFAYFAVKVAPHASYRFSQ